MKEVRMYKYNGKGYYNWDLDVRVVALARNLAQEKGWKEWDYRWNDKYLYVWGKWRLFNSIKVPLAGLKSKASLK